MRIKCTSCEVEGCQNQSKLFTKHMCNAHYRKFVLYGDPLVNKRPPHISECTVESCSRSVEALGFCTMHYQRYKKHGDPQVSHGVRKVRTTTSKKRCSPKVGGSADMRAEVYWIRASHHTDIGTEGYVGVSKNSKARWHGHERSHTRDDSCNPHLKRAISKYGWDNLIKTVVLISDEAYCYDLENKLRPSPKMGWNIAVGGGKPPVAVSRGLDYVSPLKGVPRPTPWCVGRTPSNKGVPISDETRRKVSEALRGMKQTTEQVAMRVKSRRATLESQGRTH